MEETIVAITTAQRNTLMHAASAIATPERIPENIVRIFDELERFVRVHCSTEDAVQAMICAVNHQWLNRSTGKDPYYCDVEEFTGPVLEMYKRLYR